MHTTQFFTFAVTYICFKLPKINLMKITILALRNKRLVFFHLHFNLDFKFCFFSKNNALFNTFPATPDLLELAE